MYWQIYTDENLTQPLGVAIVGEVRRSYTYATRFAQYGITLAGKSVEGHVAWSSSFGTPNYFVYHDGKEGNTLPNTFEPHARDDANQFYELYFTSALRFSFKYYYDENGIARLSSGCFEYFDENLRDWRSVQREWSAQEISNVTLTGFKFFVGKGSEITVSTTYSLYTFPEDDVMGVSYTYRVAGQTGEVTAYAMGLISPYTKLLEDEPIEPYKKKNNSHAGGRGSGTTPAGNIPNMPIASINALLMSTVQGYGRGLSYYKLTGESLSRITSKMYPKIALFEKSAASRREAFVSLTAIPYPVNTLANTKNVVHLADSEVSVPSGSADWIVDIISELNFGEFNLESFMEDTFADIAYTSMTLYLPGVGGINLDPSVCAQGSIKVDAALDCRQGNILYRVLTKSNWDERGYSIYGHFSGNVGVAIPLAGGTGFTDVVKNVAGLGMGLTTTALGMGNLASSPITGSSIEGGVGATVAGAFAFDRAAIGTAESAVTIPHYDLTNNVDNMVTALMTPGVRLVISRNRMINPPNYLDLVGLPTTGSQNSDGTCIGDFANHYVKIQSIRLDGLDLTVGEQQELLALLAKGVFLN